MKKTFAITEHSQAHDEFMRTLSIALSKYYTRKVEILIEYNVSRSQLPDAFIKHVADLYDAYLSEKPF